MVVVAGTDAHKRSHTFVAVDEVGRKLGEMTVQAVPKGHDKAIGWVLARIVFNTLRTGTSTAATPLLADAA